MVKASIKTGVSIFEPEGVRWLRSLNTIVPFVNGMQRSFGHIFGRGSKNMFSLTMPLALVRNRIKSAYDLKDPAGLRQGDAAFADYFISATVSHRF